MRRQFLRWLRRRPTTMRGEDFVSREHKYVIVAEVKR